MSAPALDLIALEDLTLAAGREVMAVYETDFETIRKSDGSPVTLADHRAEALIMDGLTKIAPGVPIVAEEQMEKGAMPRLREAFFLVDPLDGTRDFVERRGGEFTVNIGLISHGEAISGAVYAPAIGALYSGADGKAYRTACDPKTGTRTGPRTRIQVSHGNILRALTSRSAKSDALDGFIERAGVQERRPMSSSIKLCLIAAGEAELYPRFGHVNEWDLAAGHAILNAAGGGLVLRSGDALVYGQRAPDFLVRGFVAHSGGAAEKATRAALAG
jgi:3'(2'), 5'-bisphosphate nucleotidase